MKIYIHQSANTQADKIKKLPVFRQNSSLTDDKVNSYRTAAYGIIPTDIDKDPTIIILKNSTGVFLPGGGVDDIEGLGLTESSTSFYAKCEEALKREVEEELGAEFEQAIYDIQPVWEALQVFHSPKANKTIKQRCVFYTVQIDYEKAGGHPSESPDNTGAIDFLKAPFKTNWFHKAQEEAVTKHSHEVIW
jgi:8-oxo-dGTP pyrophosphatase MutT (NUDIX family)